MPDASDDQAWVVVGQYGSVGAAGEHALVLVAAGIDCRLSPNGRTTVLLVEGRDELRALYELSSFDQENRKPPKPAPYLPFRDGLTGVLAYCCLLAALYAAAAHDAFGLDWLSAGAAQVSLVRAGAWERLVTALTLHADLGHLLGNLIAGSVFGFFLSERLGSGFAWLMILLAGVAGNAGNAFLRPDSHSSIGASTAIFGAIGLLAVVAIAQRAQWRRGPRRWAPLAAGVMLLAFLGLEGERVDIGAHVAGFVAGCMLGALYLLAGSPSGTSRRDTVGAVVSILVVSGAWLIALGG